MKWQEFRKIIQEDLRLPEPTDEGFSARAKAGIEISEPVPVPRFRWGRLGTIAGSLVTAFSLGLILFLGTQVRATVSLDMNPSLSLNVNHFNQVIGIEAGNEEGAVLLESLNSQSGSLSAVLGDILSQAQIQEYLPSETQGYLLFGVSGKDYATEQNVESLVLDAVAEENVELLFLNKHDTQAEAIYSGITVESPSIWEEIFDSRNQESTLTVTTSTSATVLPGQMDNEAGADFEPKSGAEYEYITGTPFLTSLSETEFLALAETYEVSPAKLQLAILVFRGYGNFLFESDLRNLCHLSVEDLIKLYSALG